MATAIRPGDTVRWRSTMDDQTREGVVLDLNTRWLDYGTVAAPLAVVYANVRIPDVRVPREVRVHNLTRVDPKEAR